MSWQDDPIVPAASTNLPPISTSPISAPSWQEDPIVATQPAPVQLAVQSPVQSPSWQDDPIIPQQQPQPGTVDMNAWQSQINSTADQNLQQQQLAAQQRIAQDQSAQGFQAYLQSIPTVGPGTSEEAVGGQIPQRSQNYQAQQLTQFMQQNPPPMQLLDNLPPWQQQELHQQLREKFNQGPLQYTAGEQVGAEVGKAPARAEAALAFLRDILGKAVAESPNDRRNRETRERFENTYGEVPPEIAGQQQTTAEQMRGEARKTFERFNGTPADVGGKLVELGSSAAPMMIPGAGPILGGLDIAGQAQIAAEDALRAQGYDPKDVRSRALLTAAAKGAWGALTAYFGLGGKGLKGVAAAAGTGAAIEAGSEAIGNVAYGEQIDPAKIMEAGATMGLLHAAMHPIDTGRGLMDAGKQGVELAGRGVDRLSEFERRIVRNRYQPQEGSPIPTAAEEAAAEFQPKGESNAIQEQRPAPLGPQSRGDQSPGRSGQGSGVGSGERGDLFAGENRQQEQYPPQEPAAGEQSPPGGEGEQPRAIEPPARGMVRFYHGGAEPDYGPRWLTPYLEYAKEYAAKHVGAQVYYVDIPADSPDLKTTSDMSGLNYPPEHMPWANFEAPEEISKQLKPLESPPDAITARRQQDQISPQESSPQQESQVGNEGQAPESTPGHEGNVTEPAPQKKRFSRADLEAQLLDYHERTGGTADAQDEATLQEAANGDAFSFRDKLPEEVRVHIEGQPNLRRFLRVVHPGEQGYENAGGNDALAQLGEDQYFAHLDRRAGDNIPAAVEAARRSNDPQMQFLAAVHDNLPPPREGVPMEWTDAQKLRPGQEFELNGSKFKVVEDEQGYRMLKDGDEYPPTPVDALDAVPMDKGTLDKEPQQPAVLQSFDEKAAAAKQRIIERFSRAGKERPLTGRAAGGSFLDPIFEPEMLRDLAIVGANAIYKGARNLKDFTTHMMREVGDWIEPHARKLYMQARKLYNDSQAEEKLANRTIREQGVPALREKLSTTTNRETGVFKRDPKIAIGEVKLLRTYLRKLESGTRKAYEAGAREKKLDLQDLKRKFVETIRQTLPESLQGKLIGDVASIATKGQMEWALKKAENILLGHQLSKAVADVEKLTGSMSIQMPRPRVQRQPGAPVAGPEGVPMRKVDISTLEPSRRARVKKLIEEARQAKIQAQVANTIEQKQKLIATINDVQHQIKQEVADNMAEREIVIGEKLAQREDVVQGMVQKIAAPPSPATPTSEPIKRKPLAAVKEFMGRDNLSPETLSLSLFGEKSDGHQLAINNIRRGQNDFLRERQGFNDHMGEAFKKAGIEPGSKKLDSWLNDRQEITLPDAGKVSMTRNEMTEIAAAAADPETAQLVADGIEWNFASRPRDKAMALTPHDLENLTAQLTPGEKGLIDAFRAYNKQKLTGPAMEAKLRISGWAPDPHDNYFPRARNRAQIETQGLAEGWKGLRRKYLENISSMEERSVDPKTPLLVKGFLETAYRYADDTAKLIHLAEPVRDAAMVFEDPRLKGAIQRKYGETMNTRFRQLLDDTLGVKVAQNGGVTKATNLIARNVSRAWLQLNPSPMLRNIFGGTAMIIPEFDAADSAAGVGKMFSPEVYERMLKNSGVAWDRYNGGLYGQYSPMAERHNQAVASMSFTEAAKAGQLGQAIDAIPFMEWADSVPLRAAYAAAEHMVERLHPDWTPEQKMKATLEKFHEVLYRTQNGTSSTEISGLASQGRQNALIQLMLMFKSDRNKKWNGIIRAWNQGDASYRAKMIAGLALSAAASGLVGYGVKEGASLLGNAIGGKPIDRKDEMKQRKNGGLTVLRDLAGDVPGGEAAETIGEFISRGRHDLNFQNPVEQAGTDIVNAIVDLIEAAASARGRKKLLEKGETFGLKAATGFGLPIEPAYKLGKRVYEGATSKH